MLAELMKKRKARDDVFIHMRHIPLTLDMCYYWDNTCCFCSDYNTRPEYASHSLRA